MSAMLPSFRPHSQIGSATGRRGSMRHRQHGLTCNLGEPVDLSAAGMRLRSRRLLVGRIDVVLTDYTRQGQLPAEVVWTKPTGHFHYEVGLRFSKLPREMTGRLDAIAQAHRLSKAI